MFQATYDTHGIRPYLATQSIRTVEVSYDHGMNNLGNPQSAAYLYR